MKTKTGLWLEEFSNKDKPVVPIVEVRRAIYKSLGVKSPSKMKFLTALKERQSSGESSDGSQDEGVDLKMQDLVLTEKCLSDTESKPSRPRNKRVWRQQSEITQSWGRTHDNNANQISGQYYSKRLHGGQRATLRTWSDYDAYGMRHNGVPVPRWAGNKHNDNKLKARH